jgi:hypothetical protein
VLADQQAEAVAETRLAGVATFSVHGGVALIGWPGRVWSGCPAKLFERTESDAVGLAEGAVDGAGFGDAHLGAVDQRRNVGGGGVPVTDEAARTGRLVDGCLENPPVERGITKFTHRLNADA